MDIKKEIFIFIKLIASKEFILFVLPKFFLYFIFKNKFKHFYKNI